MNNNSGIACQYFTDFPDFPKTDGNKEYIQRPGGSRQSGNVLLDTGQFYCFSDSWPPFKAGECYGPKKVQNLLKTSKKKESDPMAAILSTCVKKEYVNMLGDERWLFENLIIKNQIAIIIAKSGGGKTTIFFMNIAPRMIEEHGVRVIYMDCDSPASDHKRMLKIAEQNGNDFHWVNPIPEGKDADFLIDNLKKMAAQSVRLDDVVIIMDT